MSDQGNTLATGNMQGNICKCSSFRAWIANLQTNDLHGLAARQRVPMPSPAIRPARFRVRTIAVWVLFMVMRMQMQVRIGNLVHRNASTIVLTLNRINPK